VQQFLKSAIVFFFLCGAVTAAEDEWQGVSRIVAVGDIHGDYDQYIRVLRNAELVNRRGNWIAGETHFVQVGDLPDRGPDTDRIIAHMRRIQEQAADDGGMVHPLIGNHEAMNMLGDLRYVHPGEYAAFRNSNSRRMRDNLYNLHLQQVRAANPEFIEEDAYRDQFDETYPLGYVEHRLAWGPEGDIGSWVASNNTIVKINRSLFMHGGLSPEVLGLSLRDINEQVREELKGAMPENGRLSEAESGPLWYRGLASNEESLELEHVNAVLDFYDVDHIIIGHTPGLGTVVPRFGGRVIIVDTGISEYYGAHLASLRIEGSELTTLQQGQEIRVPLGDESTLNYFKEVAEIETDVAALNNLIQSLENPAPIEESTAIQESN